MENGSIENFLVVPHEIEYYCAVHKLQLKPSLLETERCVEKKCPHCLKVVSVWKS